MSNTEFRQGQKVIAYEKGWKKVETYFLSELEGISPKYVCVNPASLQDYEKDNSRCTLKRYDRIEEPMSTPKFKVWQKVKWRCEKWDNTWRYCVVTCIFPVGKEFSYVIWADSFTEDEFVGEESRYTIEPVSDEDIPLYFV